MSGRPPAAAPITGQQLRAMRRAVGLTQQELGRRLSYSQQSVGYWEQNRRVIPQHTAARLMEVLHAELVNHTDGRALVVRMFAVCCRTTVPTTL